MPFISQNNFFFKQIKFALVKAGKDQHVSKTHNIKFQKMMNVKKKIFERKLSI